MSNNWNIDNIRKIAGLPLTEAFGRGSDEDDDEDPDARIASKDKKQAAFEKKNKNELSAAERAAKAKDKADAEAKKAEKPAEKKVAPAEKAESKAEEKTETKSEDSNEDSNEGNNEAKKRGRKASDSSKMGQARAWIVAHPEAKRGEFLTHAESFGMTKHYANAFFYTVKKKSKVEECFVLVHPNMPTFVLAENRELNQMQWVDPTSPLEPMIFESKAEAEKVVKYMNEWKSQFADILTIRMVD